MKGEIKKKKRKNKWYKLKKCENVSSSGPQPGQYCSLEEFVFFKKRILKTNLFLSYFFLSYLFWFKVWIFFGEILRNNGTQ